MFNPVNVLILKLFTGLTNRQTNKKWLLTPNRYGTYWLMDICTHNIPGLHIVHVGHLSPCNVLELLDYLCDVPVMDDLCNWLCSSWAPTAQHCQFWRPCGYHVEEGIKRLGSVTLKYIHGVCCVIEREGYVYMCVICIYPAEYCKNQWIHIYCCIYMWFNPCTGWYDLHVTLWILPITCLSLDHS